MKLERSYTTFADIRLHVAHAGAGEPVVLLHGLSGSYRWWRFTLPAVAEHYRVHMPDLIGFGGSRPAERQPTVPRMAELMVRWLDTHGIERTHLVGHSMGGQISIHLCSRWPDRFARLVLASAAGIPRDFTLAEAARLLSEVLPPRAWGRLAFLPTIAFDALRAGPRVLVRSMLHLLADDVRPLLPDIQHPALLVWGELDPLIPLDHARVMEGAIPDARLIVLRDAAHNPMADRPDAFNDIVLRFLAES